MRISELITELEALKSRHGDIRVLVSGYEDGYDTPGALEVLTVADRGEWYKHKHDWSGRFDEMPAYWSTDDPELVVVIPR